MVHGLPLTNTILERGARADPSIQVLCMIEPTHAGDEFIMPAPTSGSHFIVYSIYAVAASDHFAAGARDTPLIYSVGVPSVFTPPSRDIFA